ncbi:MAG: MoaD/ThiS family protein [Dechloromonas sp.]|nr:MoaD/ThiS family protein [Dechloromonas sp.]
MRVLIPSALHAYTGSAQVEANGDTVGAVLTDLERQFPGIRFRMVDEQRRIRRHIRIFHAGEMIFDLDAALQPDRELCIVQALSGG